MIYDSSLWIKDIELVVNNFEVLKKLYGKTILITGVTGLICSAIADILIYLNEMDNADIVIVAAGRSKERIKARFGPYVKREYFRFMKYDSTDMEIDGDIEADYIIHGASNAYPSVVMNEPVETMVSNFWGLLKLLEYGRHKGAKRLLFISSSEVYGRKDVEGFFSESQYGFVDILNVRNSYSVSKRAAETLCVSFSDEYGLDTVIVRPGHIYGPTASIKDTRVSSQWAFAAANGENIIMKSDGSQLRSYCYCLDAASAILTVLIFGVSNRAYNISNPNSVISIKDMATILAFAGGVQLNIELPTDIEKQSFNPMSNSSLESTNLEKLGWKGLFDAKTGLHHTIEILKEI